MCAVAASGAISPLLLTVYPAASMFVSEPRPSMFGNPSNPPLDSATGASTGVGWTNGNWLKSRFHFSFAEYSNRLRNNFGVLRVLNDDLVQPKRGFGEHPHRDMEICTYVLSGELSHKDSLGSSQTLSRGSVQYMTAGSGVMHSEHNLHPSAPVRFLQLWIVPRTRGLRPNYGGRTFPVEGRLGKWQHLVCDVANTAVTDEACIRVNQNVNIFVTELASSSELEMSFARGRQAYVVCAEGSVKAVPRSESSGVGAAVALGEGDAMEVTNVKDASGGSVLFTSSATGDRRSHVMVIEMEAPATGGRDEF